MPALVYRQLGVVFRVRRRLAGQRGKSSHHFIPIETNSKPAKGTQGGKSWPKTVAIPLKSCRLGSLPKIASQRNRDVPLAEIEDCHHNACPPPEASGGVACAHVAVAQGANVDTRHCTGYQNLAWE
jgi:hypothetical protein